MCRTVHASYILTCLHAYILVYLHTYVHTYKHTYSKRNARPLGIKGSLACMPPAIASAVFRWRTAGGTTTLWCLRVLLQNITQSPKLNGRRKNHNRIHSKKTKHSRHYKPDLWSMRTLEMAYSLTLNYPLLTQCYLPDVEATATNVNQGTCFCFICLTCSKKNTVYDLPTKQMYQGEKSMSQC
jgi:hypothetical protein